MSERLDNLSLFEQLAALSSDKEIIEIPQRGRLYALFNPAGMEMSPFLDTEHLPRITKFNVVIFSEAFADLRGRSPLAEVNGRADCGSSQDLVVISTIAKEKANYENTDQAKAKRALYKKSAIRAMQELFKTRPIKEGDLFVPVVRCGSNIADRYPLGGPNRVDVEAKRLRIQGQPNLLAAGVVLTHEQAAKFNQRRVRLVEGVVASGSTEIALALGAAFYGVTPTEFDTDAVVVCPAGANLAIDVRQNLRLHGQAYGAFNGGVLDDMWYVRFAYNDPLLRHFGNQAEDFYGKQVLGDGGDLTSNTY